MKRYFIDYYTKFFIIIFLIILLFLMQKMNILKVKIKNENELFRNNPFNSNDLLNLFISKKNIIQPYIIKQKLFCNNFYYYYNEIFEKKIRLSNFSLNGISFPIFIYKKLDCISDMIFKRGYFEKKELFNVVDALEYYSHKKGIQNNKDIYVIDIGGNIGVYPLYLGVLGYTILTFEPSPINYYILNKNYCYNQKSNFIIINKGLSNKEANCSYYFHYNNIGNGMLLCDNIQKRVTQIKQRFYKLCNVTLTQLNNFYPYLSDKHIALIKIDVEGSEGDALEGGIDLIKKYHVPFILVEYTPVYLKKHNTDPIKLLKLFTDNGYKISINGFLSKTFFSIDYIIKHIKLQINLYFIYMK